MSIRFASYLFYALLAGFIVVATQAFDTTTTGWLAFGAGCAFAVIGGVFMLFRGWVHRAVNAAISVLGVLMIIESLLATGSSVIWLSFAGSLGVLCCALVGLTVHELSTERVVHALEAPAERREVHGPTGPLAA